MPENSRILYQPRWDEIEVALQFNLIYQPMLSQSFSTTRLVASGLPPLEQPVQNTPLSTAKVWTGLQSCSLLTWFGWSMTLHPGRAVLTQFQPGSSSSSFSFSLRSSPPSSTSRWHRVIFQIARSVRSFFYRFCYRLDKSIIIAGLFLWDVYIIFFLLLQNLSH